MNALCNRIIKKIGRDVITLLTFRKTNRILLIQESSSGSNCFALWKLANENMMKKHEIILYYDQNKNGFRHFVKKHRLISSAQLIITTHASYKPSKRHLHLQLWHGLPSIKIGIMETAKSNRFKPKSAWPKVDYIMSYSETYNTFINACMFVDPNKYIITGAPRNDFLFLSDGSTNIRKVFGDKFGGDKLIFYLPTYRDYYGKKVGDRNYNNPFGFKEFSPNNFDNFLKNSNCKLIYKPHPHEEEVVLSYFRNYPLNNMLILRNEDLHVNHLDLYELLNASDLLITDYSSVFYDYLLLKRPMIFAPVDIDSYSENRGFLIESFETWAPGPKVFDQIALQKEISKCIADKDYFGEQRTWMLNLHHRYKDGESSKRLWEFINGIV